jgi:hypothetical protein
LSVPKSVPKTVAKKVALTLEQKVRERALAEKARKDAASTAALNGWKPVDQSKICFIPPPMVFPNSEFAQLIPSLMRDAGCKSRASLLETIFFKLFDSELLQTMEEGMPAESFYFKSHKKSFLLTQRKQIIYLCVYFRMCALHKGPSLNAPGENGYADSISEAMKHFTSIHHTDSFFSVKEKKGMGGIGIDILQRLITHCLIRPEHYALVSKKFQSIVERLGRYVAGDEKLWFFSGDNEVVRSVPSKPDQLGLWMYQLCCRLENDSVILLYFRMHDNRAKSTIPTLEICTQWRDVIYNIGKHLVAGGNPNIHTMIAMDSYYSNKGTHAMFTEAGIVHTSSVKATNFKDLVSFVLPVGYTDRGAKTGDTHSIYNPTTKENFTHHFDTQKGIGQKFNISWGFDSVTAPAIVAKHSSMPPCYEYYKFMFGDCDVINGFLKRGKFPHKRGGRNNTGMEGAHHDFVMTCVMQNMYHVFMYLTNQTMNQLNLRDFLIELTDSVFLSIPNYFPA